MSLHLGNLSSRVHRDELERVFRRFGWCNVQVRDRFGFVVYDYPVNAEKALRTLRGKNICGEPITLSWSNRQPRPLQRARGGRSYDFQRGKNSSRENYVNRKLASNGRQDYRMGFKQPDADGRRFSPADLPEETTNCDPDNAEVYMGQEDHSIKDDLANEGGGSNPNYLDNDRWGELIDNLPNGDGLEFDRYEPYQDDDRRNEDDLHHSIHPGGSPMRKDSQGKKGMVQSGEATSDQPDNVKYQQTCYNCGELGHKMRNCPRESASKRKKLSRFDHRRDHEINYRIKGEDEQRRVGSKSHGRQRQGRDAVSNGANKSNRELSTSRKHRQLIRSGYSPAEDETHRSRGNKYEKRKRRENGSPERNRVKKPRRPISTPIHSDYTASRSGSRSKSASASASRSKLRSGSLSSSSSSSSTSRRSRSRNYKSRSRSRSQSSSPTSVSFGQPLPSSPNKVQISLRDSLAKVSSTESKEVLVRSGQLVEGDGGSGSPKLEIVTAGGHESAMASLKVEEDMDKGDIQKREDDTYLAKGTRLRNPLLDKGELTEGSLSPSSERERRNLQNYDISVSEQLVAPTISDVGLRSHQTQKSMSITSEEMYTVIKHYGLKHTEEIERDIPVEMYFGSARLWPWEIIYYRRLRKGPISTENYVRRIAQNKEFGIVDKYVRSSSGWGELGEDNS